MPPEDLVGGIAESYVTSAIAAQPTTPGSPGRLTGPILDRHASSYLTAKQVMSTRLPDKVRDAMFTNWSKEGCLAAIAAAAPRDSSIPASRSSPPNPLSGNHRQLLGAANAGPRSEGERSNTRNGSNPSLNQNAFTSNGQQSARHLTAQALERKRSHSSMNPSRDGRPGLRVEELKQVLTGSTNPVALIGRFDADDSGSDSMVDMEGEDLDDDRSIAPSERAPVQASRIAAGGLGKGKTPAVDSSLGVRNGSIMSGRASIRSSMHGVGGRKDLAALLDGIDLGDSNTKKYAGGRPPY